jgi:hypothetical protein
MRSERPLPAVFAAMMLACATAKAEQPLPPPIYNINQAVPTTGSNIPRRVVTSNLLPLNRRWAELTPAEQAQFKSNYEAMYPLDEPPFPVDGLKPLYDNVSKVQRKVLARGDLVIDVEVDASGQAQTFKVMKSPDPELTNAVAAVLSLTRFKPALCRGSPCSMGFPFRMTFSVDL